jgi:GNAT superfamily N-acetyltransferase
MGGFRLGRLAVSKPLQGQGLGGELLIAAARRCILVSAQVGGSLLLIDAKDQRAADWYKSYGALEIPKAPLSLVLPYAIFIDVMKQAGTPIL